MPRLTLSEIALRCRPAALALLIVVASPQPGLAQPAPAQPVPADQIVAQLMEKGYVIVLNERTWLGRGRVVADRLGVRRELVFNPGTGEILRDYALRLQPPSDASGTTVAPNQDTVAATTTATATADMPATSEIDLGASVDVSIGAVE